MDGPGPPRLVASNKRKREKRANAKMPKCQILAAADAIPSVALRQKRASLQ
ncbi:hypothetical protein ACSS6W_003931 [Trichoderma asperelloides]